MGKLCLHSATDFVILCRYFLFTGEIYTVNYALIKIEGIRKSKYCIWCIWICIYNKLNICFWRLHLKMLGSWVICARCRGNMVLGMAVGFVHPHLCTTWPTSLVFDRIFWILMAKDIKVKKCFKTNTMKY